MAKELVCDLVCEGGGVKGIGLAGAWCLLYERGYRPKRVAGTSAGAITAALIAAGYTANEVRDILLEPGFFKKILDKSLMDRVPVVGPTMSVLLENGFYEGQFFHSWIRERLASKGIRTFAQLMNSNGESRLQVIVSDLTTHEMLVLPRDAHKLGMAPGDLEVALAVRMSMSIPFFFEPVKHVNPKTNREHLLVDGGLLSNFPVWLFDCGEGVKPRWPTFGMMLVNGEPKKTLLEQVQKVERVPIGLKGLGSMLSSLVYTTLEAHDRLYLERAQFARTISIPTLDVGTVEFDITPARVEALYQSGRKAAEDFLAHWDFDAHNAKYRSGKVERRRERIGEELLAMTPEAHA